VEGDGKVLLQIGARGFYARVQVNLELASGEPVVMLDASADEPWHRSEGWTDAAIAGAGLGLKLAGESGACTITGIQGMPADTNRTLVAIAAVRAVWAALAFQPNDALARRVEAAVLRRSELSVADLESELSGTV
jgi:hypothetical protein